MMQILSTRILNAEQRALLPPGEVGLQEYDALETEYLPADLRSGRGGGE